MEIRLVPKLGVLGVLARERIGDYSRTEARRGEFEMINLCVSLCLCGEEEFERLNFLLSR